LTARAFDRAARIVAEDALSVEQRGEGLGVHLHLEEAVAAAGTQRHARAELSLPPEKQVATLECYWNRVRHTVLHEPPWGCPVPDSSHEPLPYVRALVTLDDGRSVEDILFYSGRQPEALDVALVELLFSATDRFGGALAPLAVGEVKVVAEGRAQEVVSLTALADLPIAVALLMDVSSSLGRRVRTAAESAEDLFASLLHDGDRGSLLLFNHDVRQVVPFTSDVEALRYGASGLRAFGSTRLFDSIGYALFTFARLSHRRALIVLSDGSDTGSDLGFERVLDEAVRAGVAVYPIALGELDGETSSLLERLARSTGGRSFRAASVEELAAVYRRVVADLRSQYSVAFRSTAPGSPIDLKSVSIRVERSGAQVRHLRGSE
jgi:VWFA-related protein